MRTNIAILLACLFAACVESNPQPFPALGGADATANYGDLLTELPGHRAEPDLTAPDIGLQFDLLDLSGADDIPPGCLPGEGCFLDPCSANSECQSGWCVQHLGAGVCTQHCQEECPAGWNCQQVAGSDPDVVYICVSEYANLCRPCADSADCVSTGGAQDACVNYPGEGSFCGGPCGEEGTCPDGFSCQNVQTAERSELEQCVADAGVCECSQSSVELGLTTPCFVANANGFCKGHRICTDEGLSACDAASPSAEYCNGVDDDCDGETDEPALTDGAYVELCDDGHDCTKDLCSGETGCQYEPLDGTECKDGDPCTVGDHCQDGECTATPAICNDDNPCTEDSCQGSGECLFTPNGIPCDDQDPCTVADFCAAGECSGTSVNCECDMNSDCGALEDGDLCNGTLFCDAEALPFTCKVVPGSIVECPAPVGPDAVCLKSVCSPDTGSCAQAPAFEGFACDDGDACTVGDLCLQGSCGNGIQTNCADDNPCTDDTCEPDGGCQHTNNTAPCSDGDVCSTEDVCDGGACQGGPTLVCNDDDTCNGLESCDPDVGCLPGMALKCNDGNDCNGIETCHPQLGCQAGAAPDCDDSNPCTDDSCGPDGKCVNAPNNGWCDDANACTEGDHCQAGSCVPAAAVDCDDNNICTTDKCDLKSGCIYTTNALPCSDDSVCSTGDQCKAGSCVPGQPLNCNDGNDCTDDGCDQEDGCTFAPNAAPCADGNACTSGDHCEAGECKAGPQIDCDDDNLCTSDLCDFEQGCVYQPNSLLCDDGDACTVGDQCETGACAPGESLVCDDGDPCTDDTCNPAEGCQLTLNHAGCSDNNVCTVGDQCADGLCVPGAAVDCNDDNPCTQDFCHAADGCQHPGMPDQTPCAAPGICQGTCDDGICGEAAVEVCDGVDNTCDGNVDEGFDDADDDGEADCVDADDDGDGSLDDDDCQPLNPAVSPLAEEICFNDVDDDCNAGTDDDCKMLHCQAYLDAGLSNGDGIYVIDPDGDGPGTSFDVYCDMTTDGGGWTLCLNSVPGSKSPTTDIISNSGVVNWGAGHVRDCSLLGADTTAQIRHLVIDDDLNRVVNGYYAGSYHGTLPGENSWTAVTGDSARPGEAHTTFGGSCGFDYHFGRTWGCDGGCCQTYTYKWYYGGCWNYMPTQTGGYCADGPSDGCGGSSCIERYSIFVRPNP